MSNRTDWKELAQEIGDIYSLENSWPESITVPLLERLETEFHNAFVAGQEQAPEIFLEQAVKDPVNEMDAIDEANRMAQEQTRRENAGPTPFHDKHFGKTPIDKLTTEQLQGEIDRRNAIGPYKSMFALVKVVGIGHDGSKNTRVHWEYQDIDPLTFHASHSVDSMSLKLTRIKKR